jgi:hypothetical protein
VTRTDLVDPALPLAEQNARLRRIAEALMLRVERGADQTGSGYGLFQRAIALEGEVRARTRDLERTLDALNRANADLAAATAAAETANRAKTRFLAAASHDILAPLGAAKLFLASLEDTQLDTRQRRIAENLSSAFASLDSLLAALLEISQLESPSFEPAIREMPVMGVLDPLVREFEPLAAQQGVALTLCRSGARVASDPTWLRRIVQNLVSNAVRYSPGGRVLIGCRRRGQELRIDVVDTGPGIPEGKLDEIFREFHRLGGGPRSAETGLGLGLAIVERACKLLGHPLEIRSTPGVGTSFSVTMPLARAEADGGASRGPAESDETLIALVLSGDATLAEMLTRLLEGWGMGALSAASLEEAFERVEQLGLAPDAVIADEALADGGTGFEALEALGRRCGGRPVAVLLADRAGLSGHHAAGAPGLSLLGKPVRPHRLRAVLGRLDPGRGRPAAQ